MAAAATSVSNRKYSSLEQSIVDMQEGVINSGRSSPGSMDIDPTDISVTEYSSSNTLPVTNSPIDGATRTLSYDLDPTSHAVSYPSYPFDLTTSQMHASGDLLSLVDPATDQPLIACGKRSDSMLLDETI